MHKEIKSSRLSQIPFTFIKICVDVECRQYIRGWYIKHIFKTGAYFKCFLTKKHKWSFSRSWLRCHLCHIWASKIEMTPNHMLKCMESVMTREPITSGKERELQQAYPILSLKNKTTLHSHLAHNIAEWKVWDCRYGFIEISYFPSFNKVFRYWPFESWNSAEKKKKVVNNKWSQAGLTCDRGSNATLTQFSLTPVGPTHQSLKIGLSRFLLPQKWTSAEASVTHNMPYVLSLSLSPALSSLFIFCNYVSGSFS